MLNEIISKHVSIYIANGDLVEGFVKEVGEEFVKLVESSNSELIIRKTEISVIRIGGEAPVAHRQSYQPPQDLEQSEVASIPVGVAKPYTPVGDFSMSTPKGAELNAQYTSPEFVRSTKK